MSQLSYLSRKNQPEHVHLGKCRAGEDIIIRISACFVYILQLWISKDKVAVLL